MHKVTVLMENEADANRGLAAEHGLAFLIEGDGGAGLFDTGQTNALVHNAQALGKELSTLSWIALSHGHYDHVGGLEAVLREASRPALFAHPSVFDSKYVHETDGAWRFAGFSISEDDVRAQAGRVQLSAEPLEIMPGVSTTGQVPRSTAFEPISNRFFVELDGGKKPDAFPDDMALVLRTQQGLAIILGCAHAGVVNTVSWAKEFTGESRIHTVMGGMHLGSASEERIAKTIAAFRDWGVERIGLAHCTGEAATQAFMAALGDRCFRCPVETEIAW